MGRLASALDWTTEEGSGVMLRAAAVPPLLRRESEVRARETLPPFDDEDPTLTFERESPGDGRDPMTERTVARLTALVQWIAAYDPSSPVVGLVRAFLQDLEGVEGAVSLLRAAVDVPSTLVGALDRGVDLWRASVVDHIDELAQADHHSTEGWSSLPEYSATYVLAVVRPALDALEPWADVGEVRAGLARLEAALRGAVTGYALAGGAACAIAW